MSKLYEYIYRFDSEEDVQALCRDVCKYKNQYFTYTLLDNRWCKISNKYDPKYLKSKIKLFTVN